jgi:molybdopterin-guanine dinucleotide biosynthesis protein A
MALACVRLPGVILGNLNTPQDLRAAGILPAP